MSLWDVKQAAEFLNYKSTHIRKLANNGAIPACKLGGEWRFSKEALEEFINEQMKNNYKIQVFGVPYVSARRKRIIKERSKHEKA